MSVRAGFVAVVGRPNVGKSTLVNQLVGQKLSIVSAKPQTTRNRIMAVVNRPDGQLVLFDTPGIHKPLHGMNRRMVESAIRALDQVEAALWLVDATEGYRPADRYVAEVLVRARKPTVLGINKIDAVAKTRLLPVIENYRGLFDFAELVPVSALTGENVELLAARLVALLPESPPLFPEDVLTDQPERFFVAERIREKIVNLTREELPYTTGVLIESFSEGAPLVRIEATILVEREGHKGILIGKRGAMLKKIGTAARHEIEAFLGARVFLGLVVKVREGWRDDPRLLEQLGIGKSRR